MVADLDEQVASYKEVSLTAVYLRVCEPRELLENGVEHKKPSEGLYKEETYFLRSTL